jgi:predicted dinucleotide-binding enzyme
VETAGGCGGGTVLELGISWSVILRIGIIGSGRFGSALARNCVGAGHEILIANSRGAESLKNLIDELGPLASAGTVEEAARFGDLVFLAAHWRQPDALPSPELIKGKIVVDAMNPYAADGSEIELGGTTASEETLKRLPEARLVKAFNTIWYKHLAANGRRDFPVEERQAIFLAGDDGGAKKVVASLIEEMGFAPVDTGSLREGGRSQQFDSPLYDRRMSGAEGGRARKIAYEQMGLKWKAEGDVD